MHVTRIVAFGLLSGVFGVGLLHCDDDNPAPATQPIADAGLGDVAITAEPRASPRLWRPQVVALNLQPQPHAQVPDITVPLVLVQNSKQDPARKPDVYVDSTGVGGIGLGCTGYKFSPAIPSDPKGAGFTDGDMGKVTITGYTGGNYLPEGPALPSTIECTRKPGFPGLFNYGCEGIGPVTKFLAPTDLLTVTVAGGADLKAWNAATPPSAHADLTVTNDLWSIADDQVDGSKDLTIEYKCSDGPCNKAATVNIIIQSSDFRSINDTPSQFPEPPEKAPKNEFGLINCVDFLGGYHPNSFTVSKEVLKVIPASWTDLRIVVATSIAASGQVDEQPTQFAAGFARFGVTSKYVPQL